MRQNMLEIPLRVCVIMFVNKIKICFYFSIDVLLIIRIPSKSRFFAIIIQAIN